MIYTLTLNPAVDYIVNLDEYKEGYVNRSYSEELSYGGKGINTSVVLSNLEIDNTALGFIAGNIGLELENLLKKDNVKTNFVRLKNGNTRINVKIKSKTETDINASGPDISQEEINDLFEILNTLKDDDYITLAGSIPSCLPDDFYIKIAKAIEGKKIHIIVDAEKNLLTDMLAFKPFLIKPNHHELADIFGCEMNTKEYVLKAARNLQERGARNVFVSMASKGGVFLSETGEAYYSPAPCGKVVNSTGAGDSSVAGFLAEYIRSSDYKKAFVYGLCAGSATAFSNGLAKKEEIEHLYKNFEFSQIEVL